MTDIDWKGRRVNKPKEIWLDEKLYNTPLRIEEELCRQVNLGLWKENIKEVNIIMKFIKLTEDKK